MSSNTHYRTQRTTAQAWQGPPILRHYVTPERARYRERLGKRERTFRHNSPPYPPHKNRIAWKGHQKTITISVCYLPGKNNWLRCLTYSEFSKYHSLTKSEYDNGSTVTNYRDNLHAVPLTPRANVYTSMRYTWFLISLKHKQCEQSPRVFGGKARPCMR